MTASLLRSRYLALGVVALLFGTAVLSFNFANEYVALKGETGLTELPSVQSMLKRIGRIEDTNVRRAERIAKRVAWPSFLKWQFYRIGGMSLPYSFTGRVTESIDLARGFPLALQEGRGVLIGILVSGTCLVGLAFVRHPILCATLVLSGFCWGLPMRHATAFHDFESLFYIGLPLVLFSLVLLAIHRLSGRRLVPGLSVGAMLVFVLSTFEMASSSYTTDVIELQKEEMAELNVIRKMTDGKVVFVDVPLFTLLRFPGDPMSKADVKRYYRFFLAGRTILFRPEQRRFADFFIGYRLPGEGSLTPDNRWVFLYDVYDENVYERHIDQTIEETGDPLIHGEYRGHVTDVYLSDNRLYYVRSPTHQAPEDARFYLHVIPVDVSNLLDSRKRWHSDNLDFDFEDYRVPHVTRAVAVRILPDYAIARIHTGQYTDDGPLWNAQVSFEE